MSLKRRNKEILRFQRQTLRSSRRYIPPSFHRDNEKRKKAVLRLDEGIFAAAYPGGGQDSYHPQMLPEVILYAYTQRNYSSRQIARAVRENVMFM